MCSVFNSQTSRSELSRNRDAVERRVGIYVFFPSNSNLWYFFFLFYLFSKTSFLPLPLPQYSFSVVQLSVKIFFISLNICFIEALRRFWGVFVTSLPTEKMCVQKNLHYSLKSSILLSHLLGYLSAGLSCGKINIRYNLCYIYLFRALFCFLASLDLIWRW